MRDVSATQVSGVVVTKWRVVDNVQLLLTVMGQADEARLMCTCARCHWIVREKSAEGGNKLLATCHNCGNRLELRLEGSGLLAA